MTTFTPLNDRILVRRIEPKAQTEGGILLPDNAQEKPIEGDVLAVGPGATDHTGTFVATTVKVDDRILFGKWSGTEVEIDGETLVVMKESDVFGVLS